MSGVGLYVRDVLMECCKTVAGVCKDVYPSKRPTSDNDNLREFVVVSLEGRMSLCKAYGQMDMDIEVFVRNKGKGVENTSRLSELCDGIFSLFPVVRGRFRLLSPRVLLRGDDGLGFSVWSIRCKVLIDTTDKID